MTGSREVKRSMAVGTNRRDVGRDVWAIVCEAKQMVNFQVWHAAFAFKRSCFAATLA